MRDVLRFISSIDFYGVNQEMTILRREKYKSIFGALLSISLIAYFFYKVVIFITKFINKESYTQVNNVYMKDNEINLKSFEFSHCILQDVFSNQSEVSNNANIKIRLFSDLFTLSMDEKFSHIFEINNCRDMNNTFVDDGKNHDSGNSLAQKLKSICYCGRVKPEAKAKIYADIYQFNTSDITYHFFGKESYFLENRSDFVILSIFKNNYFDYSNKNSAIISYPTVMTMPVNPAIYSLYNFKTNKITYSEIIDFDIFYSSSKDYEEYVISENPLNNISQLKSFYEPILTINLDAGNMIYDYSITILSMDNITASFNSVFQILSLILGFIGGFFNGIIFYFSKKKYFTTLIKTNYDENTTSSILLKKIYERSKPKEFNKDKMLNNRINHLLKPNIGNNSLGKVKKPINENEEQNDLIKDRKIKNINDIQNLDELNLDNLDILNLEENQSIKTNGVNIGFNSNNKNKIDILNLNINKNNEDYAKNNYIYRNNSQIGSKQIQVHTNKQQKSESIHTIKNVNNIHGTNHKKKIDRSFLSLQKKNFLENVSLTLFNNYVSSYEFLFDMFSQMELIKRLLFDENLYFSFKTLSRMYIDNNSHQSNYNFEKNWASFLEYLDQSDNNEQFIKKNIKELLLSFRN